MAHRESLPVTEDLCQRCGRCCYLKIMTPQGPKALPVPCPYLRGNGKQTRCSVYSGRFSVVIEYPELPGKKFYCKTAEEVAKARALPNDCPYAMMVKGYKSIVDWSEVDTTIGGIK